MAEASTSFDYAVDLPTTGPGSSLSDEVRAPMEDALGHDLSDVTVHTDGLTEQLGARAFTQGNQVHLSASEDTDTEAGRRVLGHELTHVAQQREGRVHDSADGRVVADSRLEMEADRAATNMQSSSAPRSTTAVESRKTADSNLHPTRNPGNGPIQRIPLLVGGAGAALSSLATEGAAAVATVVAATASVAAVGQAVAAGSTGVQGVTLPGNQISEGDQIKLRQILQFEIINRYCDRFLAAHPELDTETAAPGSSAPPTPKASPPEKPKAAPPAADSKDGKPTGAPSTEGIDTALIEGVRLEIEAAVAGMWVTGQGPETEYVWSEADDEVKQSIGITGAVQFTALSGQVIKRKPTLSSSATKLGMSLASPGDLTVRRFVGGRLDIGPSFTRSRWDDLAINVAGGGPVITNEGPHSSVLLKLRTNWIWDNNTTFYDWQVFVSDTGAPAIQNAKRTGEPDDSRFF